MIKEMVKVHLSGQMVIGMKEHGEMEVVKGKAD